VERGAAGTHWPKALMGNLKHEGKKSFRSSYAS